MKARSILLCFSIIWVYGCAATPDQLARAGQYDAYSKAAKNRAATHAELPGTPENREGIMRAEGQAKSYSKASDKADDTLLDFFLSIFMEMLKEKKT